MCECYVIGGPFIAEDPECPAHGYEARKREEENEDRIRMIENAMESLKLTLESVKRRIIKLEEVADDVLALPHEENKSSSLPLGNRSPRDNNSNKES